ncbi:hypothetical protein LINPERHAP1_LOCUS29141 [Linum perenne]
MLLRGQTLLGVGRVFYMVETCSYRGCCGR